MKRQPERSKASVILGLGLLALVSVGCGSGEQEDSQASIYGGTKVPTGEWLTTVALIDDFSGMYCSGTAVTPNLVISAAHCASGFSASRVKVYVGEGAEGGRVKGQYTVASIKKNPKYTGSGPNDVSYFLLKEPIKEIPQDSYVPVLVDAKEISELLAINSTTRIVGFGNRNGGGFGLKFEVEAKVTKLTDNEVYIGGSGKDSCQGDSGGPVYGKLKNGQWRVFGVTSRGGACGTGGIYGLMHSSICWIQSDSKIDLKLPRGVCESEGLAPSAEPSTSVPSTEIETAEEVIHEEEPISNGGSWWNWLFG